MELILTLQTHNQVAVSCDEQPSHNFDLTTLIPDQNIPERPLHPLEDPVAYGQAVYQALFPKGTPARQKLEAEPDRIMLIAEDERLQAIPWEYAQSSEDFLILEVPFVRGLPKKAKIAPPDMEGITPHIIAVPSNPLDENIIPLNIEEEWQRLREIVDEIPQQITLERANPPTLDSLRKKVAHRQYPVVHFMGHGGDQHEGKTVLLFENEFGRTEPISAKDFFLTVQRSVFLVTLNACASAMPGDTEFSNLASALVKRKIPYALGMRYSIPDADALAFSRAFYSEISSGIPVEAALFHARRSMVQKSINTWVVGVPVLYTALSEPAPGFALTAGKPVIDDGQPPMDVTAIPKAEGAFQGRVPELLALGQALTGDSRPKLLTIHGGGGLGKTALAREAVERFAHAWPGGVRAVSLENLPSRLEFVTKLARFLHIPTEDLLEQSELERRVLNALGQRRVLLVLDNAETLVEAAEQQDAKALDLVTFLREGLAGTLAGLLVTSRYHLGWIGEQAIELGGLTPEEGARLFRQCAPGRQAEIATGEAEVLSEKVYGHPLALRLLGLAFDAQGMSLEAFIAEYEKHLLAARDKYRKESHRHHSLFASIETSVAFLTDDLKTVLSSLWVFAAPFLPETAAEILASQEGDEVEIEARKKEIINHVHILHRRGLLVAERRTFTDGTLLTYRLLPTMRLYAREMEQDYPEAQLLARFGAAYDRLVQMVFQSLDGGGWVVWLADRAREDFTRGIQYTAGEAQVWYQNRWGWVLQRLGDCQQALTLFASALETAQGHYPDLELHILNNMALVYQSTGQPGKALALYEQALPIMREVGDRAGEATTLNNMAGVYQSTGQPGKALVLLEQALPIRQEVGDRAGEAATLNNMAGVYSTTGQPDKALELYEQALPITREVGNRAGEAATLNNMALVYSDTGQPDKALALYEQALPITREVGDRAREATTLNNMALVYSDTGQPGKALAIYEQALPIMREVGDRAGEANTINNMAGVYHSTGQPGKALAIYKQALPIMREVGNRAGEAAILNNMAMVYRDTGQQEKALMLFEQALPIMREVGDRAGEAATLNNMANMYRDTGQPDKALALYEQALPIMQKVGDRAGEAITLNNLAVVYRDTGQPEQALVLLEQVLPIRQEVGDRAGEAATLNTMALVYQSTGQPGKALALLEQALPIMQKVGDRAGEAATLNNMAMVYRDTGQQEKALMLFEQALPIMREVGDRAGEAATLNNMAMVYRDTGQPDKALVLLEQALAIRQEVGDRAGEAATLNNMAMVYRDTGQPDKALALYEQALPIMREVGNRAGEAATLNNMAMVYRDTGQPGKALALLEQALPIMQKVGDRAGEAMTLSNMGVIYFHQGETDRTVEMLQKAIQIDQDIGAMAQEAGHRYNLAVVYSQIERIDEAIELMRSSIGMLQHYNLPQDANGVTIVQHHQFLAQLESRGRSPSDSHEGKSGLTREQLQTVVSNTIAVMTSMPEKRNEWRESLAGVLGHAQEEKVQQDAEFFTALLALLDGDTPTLSPESPYIDALKAIQAGIANGSAGLQQTAREAEDQVAPADSNPGGILPDDFVNRCVAGIKGGSREKRAAFNFLVGLAARRADAGPLIQAVQLAILGQDLTMLGGNLSGEYEQIWAMICAKLAG